MYNFNLNRSTYSDVEAISNASPSSPSSFEVFNNFHQEQSVFCCWVEATFLLHLHAANNEESSIIRNDNEVGKKKIISGVQLIIYAWLLSPLSSLLCGCLVLTETVHNIISRDNHRCNLINKKHCLLRAASERSRKCLLRCVVMS